MGFVVPQFVGVSGTELNPGFWGEFKVPASKLPIFYSEHYNISFWGIEKLHPFDSKKYGRVVDFLVKDGVLAKYELIEPKRPSSDFLKSFHTHDYLESLKSSTNLGSITEIGMISIMPWPITHHKVLEPMLFATGGTLLASKAAIEKGWGINLGGGFHHASQKEGGGFCVFADISMAIKMILQNEPKYQKILYIDLDVHQGNGVGRDFINNSKVYILDFYNHLIYPGDKQAKLGIDQPVELGFGIRDEDYLDVLKKDLKVAIAKSNPDFIFYNAGTDIMVGDLLGGWNITANGIMKRDEIVFKAALERNTPIVMVLSGGYQKKNARAIADSIGNLMKVVKTQKDSDTQHPLQ